MHSQAFLCFKFRCFQHAINTDTDIEFFCDRPTKTCRTLNCRYHNSTKILYSLAFVFNTKHFFVLHLLERNCTNAADVFCRFASTCTSAPPPRRGVALVSISSALTMVVGQWRTVPSWVSVVVKTLMWVCCTNWLKRKMNSNGTADFCHCWTKFFCLV